MRLTLAQQVKRPPALARQSGTKIFAAFHQYKYWPFDMVFVGKTEGKQIRRQTRRRRARESDCSQQPNRIIIIRTDGAA